tara:strand:+ start:166 stop:372 length:207 start_codon:yes stop_codon:yes gene_type:complete
MGNYLLKKSPTDLINDNKDLNKSLLQQDLIERINYLEDKIDNLDAKLWAFESKTESNFHSINKKLKGK